VEHVPHTMQRRLGWLTINFVLNPGVIYVTMKERMDQLQRMTAALSHVVENLEPVAKEDIHPGLAVAVYLGTNEKGNSAH